MQFCANVKRMPTEQQMVKRPFGSTQLMVSAIGFGCSRIGGMSAAGPRRKDSVRLLHAALDRGITFFDTADAYAEGDSERLLGEAFEGRRHEVILATKGGYLFNEETITAGRLQPALGALRRVRAKIDAKVLRRADRFSQQDFSPRYLTRAVEGSLRRLRTDYIDLYQLHAPKVGPSAMLDALEALGRLQQAGKIRYFGVGLEALTDVQSWLSHERLSSVQIPFGLLDLDAKPQVLSSIAERQVALIARGAYGGGLLKASLDADWLRKHTEKWARIARFHQIAARAGRSIYALALHYVLQQREVSLVLLGMHTEAHLDTNLRCFAEEPLAPSVLSEVDEVNAEVPLSV